VSDTPRTLDTAATRGDTPGDVPGARDVSTSSDIGADARAGAAGPLAIAGASGYVGRLLVERLAQAGHSVVAIARHAAGLPSGPGVRALGIDVSDVDATVAALARVDAAFYLVHAMAGGEGFADRDRHLAGTFAQAARRAGVRRIVYLGALGRDDLSLHLASRQEVGTVLRDSGIEVVELRAAVILGAGSISFEMLRSLTERLPVMVCPRWVGTRLQPLAEDDLLAYLEESLTVPPGTYEVGTPDVTDYGEMMRLYAEARRLRTRRIFTVPLLTPSLSARWVDLVSPVDRRVSHALIESLVNEVVVHDPGPATTAFTIRPMPVRDAIVRAIDEEAERVTDALFDRPEGLAGGVYSMRCATPLAPDQVVAARVRLGRVGGDLGWYGMAWAWRLRLRLGRLFGEHLSLRRPERIEPGATIDWWTVTRADEDHLVLAATDWFCGEGWLGYRIACPPLRLEQVAAFRPKGLLGLAYWRMLWPVHWVVFRAMARSQVRPARATSRRTHAARFVRSSGGRRSPDN
jgi:uncharacterized protein YbjT (DUF2867 family)